jgi:hypothetical protein
MGKNTNTPNIYYFVFQTRFGYNLTRMIDGKKLYVSINLITAEPNKTEKMESF